MDHREPAERPTVLLRHELPDGSWHVDWMLARDAAGEEPLVTFRLETRFDALAGGAGGAGAVELPAERLADHRPVYLTYEGPIPARPKPAADGSIEDAGARGHVRRLADGRITTWREHSDGWRLAVRWGPGAAEQRLRLTPGGGEGAWRIRIECDAGPGRDREDLRRPPDGSDFP